MAMPPSLKVYCPVCKTFWTYYYNRKTSGGKVINPVQDPKKRQVLTCTNCLSAIKNTADNPENADDRKLSKLDRLDEEEEDAR